MTQVIDYDCKIAESIETPMNLTGLDLIHIHNALGIYMTEVRFHTCKHCKAEAKELMKLIHERVFTEVLPKAIAKND